MVALIVLYLCAMGASHLKVSLLSLAKGEPLGEDLSRIAAWL